MSNVNAMTNVILILAQWGIERERRINNAEGEQFGDQAPSASDDSLEAVTSSIPSLAMPTMES